MTIFDMCPDVMGIVLEYLEQHPRRLFRQPLNELTDATLHSLVSKYRHNPNNRQLIHVHPGHVMLRLLTGVNAYNGYRANTLVGDWQRSENWQDLHGLLYFTRVNGNRCNQAYQHQYTHDDLNDVH
eukprot:COSAG02_NODE_43195_length_377_cov_0.744604_1_plen_125_part_11